MTKFVQRLCRWQSSFGSEAILDVGGGSSQATRSCDRRWSPDSYVDVPEYTIMILVLTISPNVRAGGGQQSGFPRMGRSDTRVKLLKAIDSDGSESQLEADA